MDQKNSHGKEGISIAVVRVRGLTGIKQDTKYTLDQLRLYERNNCIVLPNNDSNRGMVMKVKDYVTWGEIDDDTLNMLIEKKGEEYRSPTTDKKGKIDYNKFIEFNGKKIKKFFRLNSPRKGYGRNGIKLPFSKGGALGYRAEKIKDLIERML